MAVERRWIFVATCHGYAIRNVSVNSIFLQKLLSLVQRAFVVYLLQVPHAGIVSDEIKYVLLNDLL